MTPGDGSGSRHEWSGRGPARAASAGGPRRPQGPPGRRGPSPDRRSGESVRHSDGGRRQRAARTTRPPARRPGIRVDDRRARTGERRGEAADSRLAADEQPARPGAGAGRGGPGPPRPGLRRAGPGRRLNVSLLCIGFVLTLFGGRLVQLQGLHWAQYRALAQQQMLPPEPIPIPVLRGSITSSDGKVLAMTTSTDRVYADPAQIPPAKRPQVAAALAGPLGMTQPAILALLDHPSSPDYVVLRQDVPAAAGDRVAALDQPGIAQTPTYSRAYPNGDLAASLIGFTDADPAGDLRGEAGLEQEYNSLLSGRDGSQEVEMGPTQQPIPQTEEVIKPAVPAGSLRLSIEADIQWYAEQQCAAEVKATRARNCSVVVMQPRTGRLLALAQYPTFSPADPPSEAATADIGAQDVFEPGSTAKVITIAAALEHSSQTPMSTYTVPDRIVVDGFSFHDGEAHPTARYTIAGILANSLNDGMVQLVQHVSPQVQYQYFKAFGIGEPTGLDLPGESEGLLPPPAQWWGDERYTLSFGQGVSVTALQMASVYATIANDGVRVQPGVVAGTVNGSGALTPAPAPRQTRVLQPKTAQELMAMLQQVPSVDAAGGEPWGVIPGYSVASKTGTSQEAAPGRRRLSEYGSSYIGIVPASSPQLVVAVNVQDPTTGGFFGDQIAGPVFYHVTKFALQTLGITPDGGKRPYVRLMTP